VRLRSKPTSVAVTVMITKGIAQRQAEPGDRQAQREAAQEELGIDALARELQLA
jgi:hypothetical protein